MSSLYSHAKLNVKCCEEFPDLLKDKLDDACITDHKDFDVLCQSA